MLLSKLKLGLLAVVCASVLLTGIGGSLASVAGNRVNSSPPQDGPPGQDLTTKRTVPATVNTGAEDTTAKESNALEGEWEAVAVERYGKKLPLYEVKSHPFLFSFRGAEVESSLYGKGRYKFKLDPSQLPKAIDLMPIEGAWKGQIVGIYSLKERRLRLCFRFPSQEVKKRPTEFITRYRDDGGVLVVLERVMPKGAGRGGRPGEAAAEELGAILRECRRLDEAYQEVLRTAKTAEDKLTLTAEMARKLGPFAARCLTLADTFPDTSAGLAALCWVVSNAPASEAGKKALAILKGSRIGRADLDELGDALGLGAADFRNTSAMTQEIRQALAPLILQRVKHKLDQPRAAELLAWVCTSYLNNESAEPPRPFAEAADLIAGRFADSPDINHLPEILGVIRNPRWAGKYEKHLRAIIKANHHAHVRLEAQFALASVVQESGEGRQEEARILYKQFIKDYSGRAQNDGWDSMGNDLVRRAKDELEGMLLRGIGESAPEIVGTDLDGRPMKLSDFRGKVVLVSFWATWCGPCMKLVPHEESLATHLMDKPFAIVGVNGDSPEELIKAQEKLPVTWRSFKDGNKVVSKEWKILAFPTLFLIDHKGIIRMRWIGAPLTKELDREIDRLVEKALREK